MDNGSKALVVIVGFFFLFLMLLFAENVERTNPLLQYGNKRYIGCTTDFDCYGHGGYELQEGR